MVYLKSRNLLLIGISNFSCVGLKIGKFHHGRHSSRQNFMPSSAWSFSLPVCCHTTTTYLEVYRHCFLILSIAGYLINDTFSHGFLCRISSEGSRSLQNPVSSHRFFNFGGNFFSHNFGEDQKLPPWRKRKRTWIRIALPDRSRSDPWATRRRPPALLCRPKSYGLL